MMGNHQERSVQRILCSIFLLMFSLFPGATSFAASQDIDCSSLRKKAVEIDPGPDLQIAPADAGLWVPKAYIRAGRYSDGDKTLVGSARLTVSLPNFLPVDIKNDPAYLGTGWGDTATLSISPASPLKSASGLLIYFLGENGARHLKPDIIGFEVFELPHGLDSANQLHVSPDRNKFLLCSDNPRAPANYCETVFNPVQEVTIKMRFAIEHMDEFPIYLNNLSKFFSCWRKNINNDPVK